MQILSYHSLDFRQNLEKLRSEDRQIPGLTERGKYERNYLSVYDLMTHTEDMATEDLLKYSIVSIGKNVKRI